MFFLYIEIIKLVCQESLIYSNRIKDFHVYYNGGNERNRIGIWSHG
ncbi:hypothetical protein CDIMF43_200020 [Carnobacterium divergens]|nr:hypothetical protein CDIMF43_200020 [Carnobacterium divergens]